MGCWWRSSPSSWTPCPSSSRLNHDDKKTMDTACLALFRLADCCKHDTERLTLLAREDVLTNLQRGPGVRHATLKAMLRMVVSSEAGLLAGVLQPAFVASQVAAMFSSQDLQLSETLLAKLPKLFSVHFRHEGVLHQVQKLTDPDYTFSRSGEGGGEGGLNMSWTSPGPQLLGPSTPAGPGQSPAAVSPICCRST